MLVQKTTKHLEKLIKKHKAIKREFVAQNIEGDFFDREAQKEARDLSFFDDPLLEEKFTEVRGLVHKYKNRALLLLTLNCAAYCRFCTRRRKVSDIKKGLLAEEDIERIIVYIKKHKEIKEIIISGGDPLTQPKIFRYAFDKIRKLAQIKIIRVGTRLPVSDPDRISDDLIKSISRAKQIVYLGIHFEHPAEITPKTVSIIEKLRRAGAVLFSQSVFLRGVNDNYQTLYELFSRLIEIGVKPYYIYRCDPTRGAAHFICDFKKEIAIMTRLRRNLSGMACPLYVIDVPGGFGKIPVPLDFWKFDKKTFLDFRGKKFSIHFCYPEKSKT